MPARQRAVPAAPAGRRAGGGSTPRHPQTTSPWQRGAASEERKGRPPQPLWRCPAWRAWAETSGGRDLWVRATDTAPLPGPAPPRHCPGRGAGAMQTREPRRLVRQRKALRPRGLSGPSAPSHSTSLRSVASLLLSSPRLRRPRLAEKRRRPRAARRVGDVERHKRVVACVGERADQHGQAKRPARPTASGVPRLSPSPAGQTAPVAEHTRLRAGGRTLAGARATRRRRRAAQTGQSVSDSPAGAAARWGEGGRGGTLTEGRRGALPPLPSQGWREARTSGAPGTY